MKKKRLFAALFALSLTLGHVSGNALAADTGKTIPLKDPWDGIACGSITPITQVVTASGQLMAECDDIEDYPVYIAEFTKPTDVILTVNSYESATHEYYAEASVEPVPLLDNYEIDWDKFDWEEYTFHMGPYRDYASGEAIRLAEGTWRISVSGSVASKDFNGYNGASTFHYTFFVVNKTVAPQTVGGFTDVTPDVYFADPVLWAVGKNITNGTTATTFSPSNLCTRAQIITFLWHAAGSPEPKKADSFADVAAGAYYAKACAWAAENGIVSGKTFAPNTPCTREMAVEFMWKSAGSPKAPSASFNDVSAPAVDWAVANGVTAGTTVNTFSPNNTCTRAQIVTFLYRYMGK